MDEIGLCYCGCGQKTKICTRNYIKEGYVKGDYKRFLPGHWIKSRACINDYNRNRLSL